MQAFMFRTPYDRIAGRIAAMAPDLDVVVLEPDGGLTLNGQTFDAAGLKPDIWWLTLEAFGAQTKDYFGRLKASADARWVQTVFAGVENPVFKPLAREGLLVTNSSAQAPAIAEYVSVHALSLLHPIAEQQAHQDARTWKPVNFREVGQTRWLIVGFGNIGREIAVRAKAFGAQVEAVRRAASAEGLADAVSTLADLPERLPDADVVVLACALNDETRDLANAEFFAAMKPGSILINIGRGGLVDEDALRTALDADKPAHAVLDVFKTEPLPADSWFWDHPKVRVTPHASNRGALTGERGDALFLENLGLYLRGEPLRNRVNPADIGVG
ncbi:MAG: D-2-hydroxyacid dehydrogenase [Pseudomonadota bacterium]|uniref:D-2-hydroxyacid dehydrogenase n=1 Tax=Phenylobacterium sp. TaxID=1871053 RepID=UPI0025DBA97D|nr:D-2-hydroxyacid dehydrogenase [Phenylobacterium sp.]MBT9470982.1 D-2-hydroxyacid dehydrogenase [Phenylobacterium sp.]